MPGNPARARARLRLRSRIEVGPAALLVTLPDGRPREFNVAGAELVVGDAMFARRFVRHLRLSRGGVALDLITPPELGAIAPRAAQLPRAPDESVIVERAAFETVHEWLAGGSRLGGRTIEELSRLAAMATAAFAVAIGERAGRMVAEGTWSYGGPMRGGATESIGDDLRRRLRPFEQAARKSDRVADALTAALAAIIW